jgi:hypothetical protein
VAFTDHCDLFASISEDGINLIAKHVLAQRPSLFNYATEYIVSHQKLACRPVAHTVDVTNHGNPLFTTVPALPVFGADSPPVGLNFCVQAVSATVDFAPGNTINLPAQLNPPLQPQHLALQVRICGGLDCPSNEIIDIVPVIPPGQEGDQRVPPQEIVLPTRRLQCFCIDAYAVGHIQAETLFGKPTLIGHVDSVHVDGIAPPGLSANIDCYIRTTFELLLREKLTFPAATMLFNISLLNAANVTATLTPNPPIPNNPAIETDQLKLFVNLQIS